MEVVENKALELSRLSILLKKLEYKKELELENRAVMNVFCVFCGVELIASKDLVLSGHSIACSSCAKNRDSFNSVKKENPYTQNEVLLIESIESILEELEEKIKLSRSSKLVTAGEYYSKVKRSGNSLLERLKNREAMLGLKEDFHNEIKAFYLDSSPLESGVSCPCPICVALNSIDGFNLKYSSVESSYSKSDDKSSSVVNDSDSNRSFIAFYCEHLRSLSLSELVPLIEKHSHSTHSKATKDILVKKKNGKITRKEVKSNKGFKKFFMKDEVVADKYELSPIAKSILEFRMSLPPKIDNLITNYKSAVEMGASASVLEEAEKIYRQAIVEDELLKEKELKRKNAILDEQFTGLFKEAVRKNSLDIDFF